MGLYISSESTKSLVEYMNAVLSAHRTFSEFRSKMESIDVAYARYQTTNSEEDGDTPCGDIFTTDNVVAPIVVSQVDSMVAYLADIFVGGYPLFPVVSTPKNLTYAEQLETLLDDHATLGGYARQILLFLKDGVKYNFSAIELSWEEITQFNISQDYTKPSELNKINRGNKAFTKLTRRDPYNTIWDHTVAPGDVASEGDYAGYVEILSKTKQKRRLNKLSTSPDAMLAQIKEALKEENASAATDNYTIHPQVSDYISARKPRNGVDWYNYITGANGERRTTAGDYEFVTLYARIIPSDFGLKVPQANTPQIWKLQLMNGKVLVEARRIVTAYDYLPMIFGQPLEDGLGYQTQSVAESEIPIQEAATKLFNIRFSAARRAVSDRALYDASAINMDDINSTAAAPKIPVRANQLAKNGLESYYKAIPFDMRGTETVMSDAAQLVEFSKQLSGLNNAKQGQFQKGNKSVVEWNDTQGSADTRLRLPAICLEHQAFVPMRAILVLNIFQFGEDVVVVSQKSGETMEIKMDELRRQVLSFRLADGYSPKAKLASTDMIIQGMNLISQSPMLQQEYGSSLPSMFAHMMQLGGVRGLDQYSPDRQALPAPAGLTAATLQPSGVEPPANNVAAIAPPTNPIPGAV